MAEDDDPLRWYGLLEDGTVVKICKKLAREYWSNDELRRIASTSFYKNGDEIHVSTIFIPLDHSSISGGDPVVFETMIFGGDNDGYQKRYSSLGAAQAGHNEACSMVEQEINNSSKSGKKGKD